MSKKEERLSLKARNLLDGARKRFSHDPKKAVEYLQSVDPKQLTMYDRQKIGREIISRLGWKNPNWSGYDAFKEKYDLLSPIEKTPGRYPSSKVKQNLIKEADNWMYQAQTASSYSNAADCYERAGENYEKAGLVDKASHAYGYAAGHDPHSIKAESRHKKESEMENLKTKLEKMKSRHHSGLEKASATTAIIALAVSIFFLSTSNLTGNVVSNVTRYNFNIIGGILFLAGIFAAFFYFKTRKK